MIDDDPARAIRLDAHEELTRVFQQKRHILKGAILRRFDARIQARIDPSDIIQETLMEAYRRLNDYLQDPVIPFEAWLTRLADQQARIASRKHLHAQMRAAGRETGVAVQFEHLLYQGEGGPVKQIADEERLQRLNDAIGRLSPQAQEIIRLRFIEEMSLTQIAKTLDLSVDAVSKRAMRSLTRLIEIANQLGIDRSPLSS